jgi:hypothetical protein
MGLNIFILNYLKKLIIQKSVNDFGLKRKVLLKMDIMLPLAVMDDLI